MDTEETAASKPDSETKEEVAEVKENVDADAANSPDDNASASAQTQADDSSATAVGESVVAEEEMRDVVDDEQGETVLEADEDTVIY